MSTAEALILALQLENARLRAKLKHRRSAFVRDGRLVLRPEFEHDFFLSLKPDEDYYSIGTGVINFKREIHFAQKNTAEFLVSVSAYGTLKKCTIVFMEEPVELKLTSAAMQALLRDLETSVTRWVARDPRDFKQFLSAFLAFTAKARTQLLEK